MKFRIPFCAVLLLALFGTGIGKESQGAVVKLSPEEGQAHLLNKVDPVYPPMARIAHIQGDVILAATISKEGFIKNLRAISGHPLLIQSAIDAVRQWKYQPFSLGGEPVEVETTITVSYGRLSSSGPPQGSSTQRTIELQPWILYGKLLQGAVPEYPEEARQKNIQGDVSIGIVVDPAGNVADAKWIDDGASPLLSQPAVEAVRQWKFQPWLVDGKPVAVASWVVVRFQITDKPVVQILTRDESSTPANRAFVKPRKPRVSSGVADSNKISGSDPVYPQEARIAHVQGDVVLHAIIGKQGDIDFLEVMSGHPLLAKAALDAVKTWKYKPWLLNGEPVEVETMVTIKFHM